MDSEILNAGYIELHLHTNFSFLDGASHPKELVDRAVALGYPALAITDHDNLFGAVEFAGLCRKVGIRPITGLELTLAKDPDHGPRHHLTLLARDRQGYGNLCRLASYTNGLGLTDPRDKERRRLDPCLTQDLLAEHCEGLVCLTGCRQSELAQTLNPDVLRRWIEWFGRDYVFVELQENLVHGDRRRNRALVRLAAELGVETIATGNVHYHQRYRHRLQDALVAIKHRTTLEQSHPYRRPNGEFQLRTPSQQLQRFAEFPRATANTLRVAQMCQFDLNEDLGYRLPAVPLPDGQTTDSWLAEICLTELHRRYPASEQEAARERLQEEMRLVTQHGLAGFFLIYRQVLELATEVAAEVRQGHPRAALSISPGRGRGSSVGSLVCYLIGLSHIDPIRNRLFMGRFLNDHMEGLPDIDLDFPRDIRERLLERVHQHWGPEHAALVASFPRYRIRSAIRDLGKVLGLPATEIDRLAKLSEGYGSAKGLKEEMLRVPQFGGLVDGPGWRELIELAYEVSDFPRHLSQHVGGMVISSDPLVECVPIQPAAWPNRYVCHWDKDSIDDARMVKIDFLGLGMLSLVEECLDLIHQQRGELVDLSRIDFADQVVYDRIGQGDTIGVFQIESRAQSQMLVRTQPRNLDDLTIQVAIVRPGPIVGGAVNPYVRMREALRNDREYRPPNIPDCIHDVLEETMGVVLFQEQVTQVAMNLGGMTAARAERFRKAMSRHDWDTEEEGYRSQFMAGAKANGVADVVAERYYQNLLGFASFGFPKSHAAAFGLLSYQSTWLREYYTPEFYCALYNQWPMGFYPPHVFTNDARRHGVTVLRPNVNHSLEHCTVEHGGVRLGLGYVRGVQEATASAVVSERDRGGNFASLFDFVHRVELPSKTVENLIRVGAFE
ncbi:MAG TPA: DNA polymerase III subunit alpha, partial [Candidatus Dormibacteraeota bacterium]|nr:DNA polymerase III subunit alpha [Candidatus Dormibacteraeota bacterium]